MFYLCPCAGVAVSHLTQLCGELFAEYLACLSLLVDKLDLSTSQQVSRCALVEERRQSLFVYFVLLVTCVIIFNLLC